MIKKSALCLTATLIVLFAPGCNDDIFVDADDLPDFTDLSIDGDGGEWSSAFSRKGLTRISVNDHSSNIISEYYTYYGLNGGVVGPDCPLSELGSIVYENPLKFFSIGFRGDMIYITSHYNASRASQIRLRLSYDYGATKDINVTFTEGEPLSLRAWELSGDLNLEENFREESRSTSFTNGTSLSQKFEIRPFLDSRCNDVAMPADPWARGLDMKLPMPAFNGNDWEWREYDNIRLGESRHFSPAWAMGEKLTVDVPAGAKAKVTYTFHYTRVTQSGYLFLYNKAADQTFKEDVNWTSIYATSYDYTVEYE